MNTFIISSQDGIGTRELEALNLLDICEKMGWCGVQYTRHTHRYLAKTPFKDRQWDVLVPSVIAGHNTKYTIKVKPND